MKKRIVSLFTSLLMMFSLAVVMPAISVSATQSKTGNFNKSYTLTGNAQNDMVAIARAQVGRTQSQFGYTEAWCANFVSDCAKLANQGAAIPANGSCYSLMTAVKNAGGYTVNKSEALPGDLVFFSSSSYPNGGAHVELVYGYSNGVLKSIGGNCYINGAWRVYDRSNGQSSSVSYYCVVRPNYGNIQKILPGYIDDSWNVPVYVTALKKISTYNEYGNIESDHYIDIGDNCYISEVYTNGFVKVEYPVSSGKRWAYAKRDDFKISKKQTKHPPTGYNIELSSTSVYDCESVKVTITGYGGSATSYKIFIKTPSGEINTANMGSKNVITFWPHVVGTYQVYAGVYNNDGYYEGSTSDGCVNVSVKRANMGTQIDLGSYFTASIINVASNNALTNDVDNVTCRPNTYSTDQQWKFIKKSDNSYEIKSLYGNGKYLDANSRKGRQGDNVQVYQSDDEIPQTWFIYSAGNDSYYLMPTCSNSAVLDVYNGSGESGANLQIWAYNQTNAQKFYIKKLENASLKFSTKNVELDLSGNNSKTVDIAAVGLLPSSYHFSCTRNTSVMSTSWGEWSGNLSPLTIKGIKVGSYTIKITLVDANTNKDIYFENIYVNIRCSHKYNSWTTTKYATCTEVGSKKRTCSVCGKTETQSIDKTGHKAVIDKAVTATCTTDGKTEGSHCSVCGAVIKAQTKISATGHKSSDWIIDKPATEVTAGSKHKECTVCKTVLETENIPATGINIELCDIALTSTSQFFRGTRIKPVITVKNGAETLKIGTDYKAVYSNNLSVGTATVTIIGIGKYTGSVTKTYDIIQRSINNCDVMLDSDIYSFNGTRIKPSVKVYCNGVEMYNGNYTVAYSNNLSAGTATITLTGKKNLKGTVTKTFKINPRNIANCTVELTKNSANKYQPNVAVKIGSNTIYNGNYTVKYVTSSDKKTVKVTLTGKGNLAGTVTKTYTVA